MFKTYKEVFGVTHVLLRVSGFLNFGRKHTLFRTFHQIYQSIAYLTFLLFTVGTILQLCVIREDSHLVYTSLSATLGTGGIFVKTTLLMRKRIRIGALQKQINETLVAGEDAEEPGVRQFYEKAVKEMKHMYTMVYVMTAVLITMWIVSGVVASLSDVPKTVPLPNWVPWDVDYLPLYIFTVFYQGHGAYFVGLTGVSINLTIFGSVIQLCSEFDVLTKNILDVKKWCENAIENGREKFRVLDAKENLAVERLLLKNVRHHQRIIYCVTQIEDFYHHIFLLQFIFTGSLGTVLSVKIIMMIHQMDSRVLVPGIFYTLLWVDIFYFCAYGTRLKTKSSELNDAVYSLPWEIFNSKNKMIVQIIILKIQRQPRLTIEKISDMDMKSLLQIVKIVYNIVYWVLQLSDSKNG